MPYQASDPASLYDNQPAVGQNPSPDQALQDILNWNPFLFTQITYAMASDQQAAASAASGQETASQLAADPQFQALMQNFLQTHWIIPGVSGNISQDQFTSFVEQMAGDPAIQALWANNGNTIPMTELDKLWNPKTSPNQALTTLLDQWSNAYGEPLAYQISLSQAEQAEYQQYGISPTGRAQEAIYDKATSLWEQYFGRKPTDSELQNVISHGSDAKSYENYIRSLPSHISGMNMGLYTDGRALVDNASQSIFGHNGTDGIVKELNDTGRLNAGGTKLFYEELGAKSSTAPNQ